MYVRIIKIYIYLIDAKTGKIVEYCRSGNIREVVIFTNFTRRTISQKFKHPKINRSTVLQMFIPVHGIWHNDNVMLLVTNSHYNGTARIILYL